MSETKMNRQPLVMKFGGTSVQDAQAMRRVAAIVRQRSIQPVVVVVSALAGVTDALIHLFETIQQKRPHEAEKQVEAILKRHQAICDQLVYRDSDCHALYSRFSEQLQACVRTLLDQDCCRSADRDALLAFGELLSSVLLAWVMREEQMHVQWLDAREYVKTHKRSGAAPPIYEATYDRIFKDLNPLMTPGRIFVTQGFIGSTLGGKTTILGRGGSDFSASLFAAGLRANRLEIWTDVDGIMTADPRLVKNARPLDKVTFSEAAELAYFGAKVLHPATLLPTMERNIPVVIRNTMNPDAPGTLIHHDEALTEFAGATSVAYKKGITVINITSARMLMAWGFLYRVFEVFNRYQTPVDLVATSEVSISLTIDETTHLDEICETLRQFAQVEVYRHQALICLVGRGMRSTPGIAAKLFKCIQPVNVRMISQGASEINISFIIDEKDLPYAVNRIHQRFFEKAFRPQTGA